MKKVLFVFWHGLGDNIAASAALRKYKQETGNYIGWAMLRRFQSAKLLEHNPHIDQLHWTSDAWLDHGGYDIGIEAVSEEGRKIGKDHGYDEVIICTLAGRSHRIHRAAANMGVTLNADEVHPEFFYKEGELKPYYDAIELPEEYVFFHGKSGAPRRCLDIGWTRRYLERRGIDLPVVSPDFSWNDQEVPIAFSVDVMKKAKMRIVTNSVSYWTALALDLSVDLAWFRMRRAWKQCMPIWDNPAPIKPLITKRLTDDMI